MSKRGGHHDVVILGAGLAGLSVARHLRTGYRLLEAAARVGGLCTTVEDHGFRFDKTGHLLHLRDAGIRKWVLGLLGERLVRIDRRSRIFSHGVYTRYPYQANTFGLPPQVAYECLSGFLAAWERRERGPEPRDFEHFILKYFGPGIAEHFMVPYNTKLWGVPPREMSTAWTDRFVPKPTLDDVLKGAVGLHDRELGYNAEFLYPRSGIGELPEALHAALRRKAELGTPVEAVDLRRRTVRAGGTDLPFRWLVSTLPLSELCRRLHDAPAWVARTAARLRCTSLTYLDVALDRTPGNDFHWSYVPEPRLPFYRVGAYSNFSEELVPRGKGALYVELAARGPFRRCDGPAVARGLVELGLIRRAGDVRFVRPRVIPHAYVVYDRAWDKSRARLLAFLREHRILSVGRYGSWEYSAMEDALLAGRAAARTVEENDR
ncbi:MAG: FAD-dependent oxidoreductase [Deltaproteobacteria bacterium]|nr:FAD-dependent oxidoreductase [Deltaproteobacteria bacterium]